jgi:hypothetical protein
METLLRAVEDETKAGGSAHSPRRRCAEPSHAGALVDPDRPINHGNNAAT